MSLLFYIYNTIIIAELIYYSIDELRAIIIIKILDLQA